MESSVNWKTKRNRETDRSSISVGSAGIAAISACVYGCAGARRICAAAPVSTMRPPCITAMRVASCATTGRLCEISRYVSENRAAECAAAPEFARPTETSSAETGSSATTTAGATPGRARCRCAAAARRKIRADSAPGHLRPCRRRAEFRRRARGARRGREPRLVNFERLADNCSDAHSRIERSERILKHHLHFAAKRAQRLAARGEKIASLDEQFAGVGLDQAQQHARERRLAAAGFADDRERFAGGDSRLTSSTAATRACESIARVLVEPGKCLPQISGLEKGCRHQHCAPNELQKKASRDSLPVSPRSATKLCA